MHSRELLWTINEERRREALATARERWTKPARPRSAASIGRLVGWLRERLRVRRDALGGSTGWTLSR
jgi:hypothetical protein